MIDGQTRRIIQKSDKYSRLKDHACLFPGCTKLAIKSHSVPRASCIEALAENGILYSRRLSLNECIGAKTPFDAPDVVRMGVNDVGVFKGYCPTHDSRLFASAELMGAAKGNGMFHALHLKSLSVEYCRKRQVLDFYCKASRLADNIDAKRYFNSQKEEAEGVFKIFKSAHFYRFLKAINPQLGEQLEYFFLPFTRNLHVSCCGVFNSDPGNIDSTIAYNIISYSDASILSLTTLSPFKLHLDSYIEKYKHLPNCIDMLINEIAFSHCEEPLISSKLWNTLSDYDRAQIRLSLRHPHYRLQIAPPQIIKLGIGDFPKKLTPAIESRLPPSLRGSFSILDT